MSIEQHGTEMHLVALCDGDPEQLYKHKYIYKVPAYLNMDEMLENEQIDVVVLSTPSGLHADQTVLASKYQINVITEKPMATTWEDGLRMVEACEISDVRLFVVKQNRHNTTLQMLKRAIDENRFGKIHLVHLNIFWTRSQSYYDQGGGWRGKWKLDGGAFMNQASHYFDLLHWLIGPVEKIHAMTSTFRKIEAEDTGIVNISWRNGTLGSMSITMLTYPKNLEGSITILGEKGTVRVGGLAVNQIEIWDFEEPKEYDNDICAANYDTTSVYGFGHPKYYNNVIKVLRGQAEPETDGREGLKSLELIIASYMSAKSGQTILLPLKTDTPQESINQKTD